ncbi:MAG: hypothetical protein IIB44_05785 [Candidatus Marinimicrobia bacterium]|nr:hypothetical protein [Candidatus Neomarinimicrobiota bacterium]
MGSYIIFISIGTIQPYLTVSPDYRMASLPEVSCGRTISPGLLVTWLLALPLHYSPVTIHRSPLYSEVSGFLPTGQALTSYHSTIDY